MSKGDPLKTAMSIGNVDDTSLALPARNQCGSGEQRVRAQVQTVRRMKSRHSSSSKSESTLSPTSPVSDSMLWESAKVQSKVSNGSMFLSNGFSKNFSTDRSVNNHRLINNLKGSTVRQKSMTTGYHQDRKYAAVGRSVTLGHANTSRSDSGFVWQNNVQHPSIPQPSSSWHSMPQPFSSRHSIPQPSISRHSIPQPSIPQISITQPSIPRLSITQPSVKLLSVPQPSIPQQRHSGVEQWGNRSIYMNQSSTNGHYITRSISHPQPLYTVNGSGLTHNKSQYIGSQPDVSKTHVQQTVTDSSSKTKVISGVNGNAVNADITMKEAVQFLSSNDEHYQNCGASYIQHNTFTDDKAKEEVLKLKGIHPLVGRLRSPNSQVKQTVSAALRNLSYKNEACKDEIHRCDGIPEAVAQLRESESAELDKQLTGLLWNLSSSDNLKPDLLKNALPVLMERVILPHTTDPRKTEKDPELFLHATGCLRNLSSAKQVSRQMMRKCQGLVDSLAGHMRYCLETGKTDDESLENCVCVLHNLTFQLESEVPNLFTKIHALSKNMTRSTSQNNDNPVGCFSSHSKAPQMERTFDYPVMEDPQPKGVAHLIHSTTLQDYLTLLQSSSREELQEVSCGTLQNLTAHEGIVSNVMSQIIVQKLNGLPNIIPFLKSEKVNLQKISVALVGNLIKNPSLHQAMDRKTLPPLLGIITEGTSGANQSDDTLAMACQAASGLVLSDVEFTKRYLKHSLIQSLGSISQNIYFPKSNKAAAILLIKLWSDKELQSFLKKEGMNKSSFVNDTTMAVHRSLQIVD
uniref:Plakophilin 1b n=1 Tax=Fundulus heteroclitus TaxID=8078 RepID=A0A3Q2PQ68_FUNHE